MTGSGPADQTRPVIFIVGPTASGKTNVVSSLAKKLPIEVINCDSMQVYKGMPNLSQVPSAKDKEQIQYHLCEFLSPSKEFNAAQFVKETTRLIKAIHKRGRVPVVAGGTGLYVDSLLDGLFIGPGEDKVFRQKYNDKATRLGSKKLHEELKKKDPEAAKKIHPSDTRRLIRALEVIHLTGKKFSLIKKDRQGIRGDNTILFGLSWPREKLYERIEKRVDVMFRKGVVTEVKKLQKKKLSKTANMCLGYREIKSFLDGQSSKEEAMVELKQNTRRFAKRQITWFKRDKSIHWFDMNKLSSVQAANAIKTQLKSSLEIASATAWPRNDV